MKLYIHQEQGQYVSSEKPKNENPVALISGHSPERAKKLAEIHVRDRYKTTVKHV